MTDQQEPERRFREHESSAPDAIVEAVGTASEALEYVVRARGHLYSFHQLIGRADLLFGQAAEQLDEADATAAAHALRNDIVGRNVLDGRWTFQIVEEFDDLYHRAVCDAVAELEAKFQRGQRHVYEARMKEQRRSAGQPGHEHRPPTAHRPQIETDRALEVDD